MLYHYARGVDQRKWEGPGEKVRKSVGAQITWGVRFDDIAQTRQFVGQLAGEVSSRLHAARVKARCIQVSMMRAVKQAPDSARKGHLGHGICDHMTRSVTLSNYTDDAKVLETEAWKMVLDLKVPATEVRGLGIQAQKLNSDPSSKAASSTRKGTLPAPAPRVFDATKAPEWVRVLAKQASPAKTPQHASESSAGGEDGGGGEGRESGGGCGQLQSARPADVTEMYAGYYRVGEATKRQVAVDELLRRGGQTSAESSPEKPRGARGGGKGGSRGGGGGGGGDRGGDGGVGACAAGSALLSARDACDAMGRSSGVDAAVPREHHGIGGSSNGNGAGESAGQREQEAVTSNEGEPRVSRSDTAALRRGADARPLHGAGASTLQPEVEAAERLVQDAFDLALLHLVAHLMPSLSSPCLGHSEGGGGGGEGGGREGGGDGGGGGGVAHGKLCGGAHPDGGGSEDVVRGRGVRGQVQRELEKAGAVLQRGIADALAQGDESGAEHLVDVAFHLLLRLWARPTTRGTGGGGERERTREREVGGRDGGGDEGEGRELFCPASTKVRTLLPHLHGGGGAENDSNSEGKEGRAFKRMKTGGTAVPRVHASNSAESVGTDTQAHAGTRAQTDTLVAWMVTTWKEIVQNVLAQV